MFLVNPSFNTWFYIGDVLGFQSILGAGASNILGTSVLTIFKKMTGSSANGWRRCLIFNFSQDVATIGFQSNFGANASIILDDIVCTNNLQETPVAGWRTQIHNNLYFFDHQNIKIYPYLKHRLSCKTTTFPVHFVCGKVKYLFQPYYFYIAHTCKSKETLCNEILNLLKRLLKAQKSFLFPVPIQIQTQKKST